MESLGEVFREVISFLEKERYDYLVIGGIASGILGNPRMTQDIDICIFIQKSNIKNFLQKARECKFDIEKKEMLKRAETTGTFKIQKGKIHIDFIISSTDFEKEALLRRKRLKVYGIKAWFPSPEDLILFKIIPARYIDVADIEAVIIRYSEKLDTEYLLTWAKRLSDEAEDMRIYNELQKLLER